MAKLKKIHVFFYAKLQATLMALLGLIAGIIYSLGGLLWELTAGIPLNLGTILAFLALLGMPALFAMVGFITGGISALLYNRATPWVEGIEIDPNHDIILQIEENNPG
ncbi:MAG: hypothetical protein CME22_02375 [Gemmatimonadetes bacterium]|jgi:hypothetical protein|nr:hypothetical protein [Gemmatimonadota bacterium]|tara:strand:+ start:71 stop:394 length:324 start_codon:yes stop_codon:yes gene_type:complete